MGTCWCKCGCQEAYECDPCRMGDHVTMTREDWDEYYAKRSPYPEDEEDEEW